MGLREFLKEVKSEKDIIKDKLKKMYLSGYLGKDLDKLLGTLHPEYMKIVRQSKEKSDIILTKIYDLYIQGYLAKDMDKLLDEL